MNDVDMEESCKPRSDQWNADDFIGGPKTFEIERVTGNEGNKEQPVNIYLKGHKLPYRPSKSMRRVILAVYGPDAKTYIGKRITLFRNPEITFGGVKCGGIQISHMSGMDKPMTMALTASRAKRAPYTVKPLEDTTPTIDPDAALQSAKDAAKKGKLEFSSWWKENPPLRDSVKPYMDELKSLVEDADNPDIDPDEVPL